MHQHIDRVHILGIGLLRRLAGDAIGGLTGAFAGLFMDAVPFDDKSLSNVREIQMLFNSVVIQILRVSIRP